MNAPWSPAPQVPRVPQRTSRLAIAALVMAIFAVLGIPLALLVVPNAVVARDAWDAFVVVVVVAAVFVAFTLIFAIIALASVPSNDPTGKLLAILAIVGAVIAPVIGGVVGFFGLLIAAGGGAHGRPLRRRGVPVLPPIADPDSIAARSWSADDEGVADAIAVDLLEPELRAILSRRWLEDARTEHASVATFAKLALDLLAVGAPPDLVARASEAAADEVHHARIAYAIASRYAGRAIEPLPFVDAMRPVAEETSGARLARLARESLLEGVVGEGACVLAIARASEKALDPSIASHLRRLATDEARHADLAADVVRFAVAKSPASVAELERALAETMASVPTAASEPDTSAHGVFTASDFRAAVHESREEAIVLVASLCGGRRVGKHAA